MAVPVARFFSFNFWIFARSGDEVGCVSEVRAA